MPASDYTRAWTGSRELDDEYLPEKNMKNRLIGFSCLLKIITLCSFIFVGTIAQAVEVIAQDGAYKSIVVEGKIYSDQGKYEGMITPEGKMYDKDGKFTGQIKNQSILNADGSIRGFVREGKIYDKDGQYDGQLK